MGTHMNFYDGGKYAYLERAWDDQLRMENAQRPMSHGLMIVDMSDPAHVKEVSRWWVPGQRRGEEEEYKKFTFAGDESSWTSSHGALTVPKRVEDGGTVGYGGFGAFGMYVMNLTDITKPKPYGRVRYEYETIGGIPFHTCHPIIADAAHPRLQNIVIGIPETIQADCREPYKIPYVVDVRDPRNPKIIGFFPRPVAPPGAPYSDFCFARGHGSTHGGRAVLLFSLFSPLFPKDFFFFLGLGFLFALGLEGIICLLMAIPIAVPGAVVGAMVAFHLQSAQRRAVPMALGMMFCAVSLMIAVEPAVLGAPAPYTVRTAIEIEAPPATVWAHLVEFAPIAAPLDSWWFRAGVAYPISAALSGRGIGAVRTCEFSTGRFVETIRKWDEGRELAFTVDEAPPSSR